MKLLDRLKLLQLALSGAHDAEITEDAITLEPDPDGLVRRPCWFCDRPVEFDPSQATTGAAMLMIGAIGSESHQYGLCHLACAERAKGSLADQP